MTHTLSLVFRDDHASLSSLRLLRSFVDRSSSLLIFHEPSAIADSAGPCTQIGRAERRRSQRRIEESEGRQEDREQGVVDAGVEPPPSVLSSLRFLRSFADKSSSWLILPEPSAIADSARPGTQIGHAERLKSQRRIEESEGRQEDRASSLEDSGCGMTAAASSSLRFLRSFADKSSSLLILPEPSAIADSASPITQIGRTERWRSQRRIEESEGRQEDHGSSSLIDVTLVPSPQRLG